MRPGALKRVALPVLLLWLATATASAAQEQILSFFEPVRGSLEPGAQESWRFNAPGGSMISLVARALNDRLDPRLDVHDDDGVLIASNDDVDWPANTSAVIEALSLPASGDYSVRVSGAGNSAGNYELLLLQGWSELAWDEDFNDGDAWQASTIAADTYLGEGRAVLILKPPVEAVTITRALELPPEGYALHADITEVAGNRGWRLGLVSHWQSRDEWARFSVDDQGRWQFLVNASEGLRVLRGWSEHPAIRKGEDPASLGLAYFGDSVELFYNQKSLGRITEGLPESPGRIGLYVGTGNQPDAQLTAWFSGLRLTTPVTTAAGGLVPAQLHGKEYLTILRNLQRQRIVPGAGELSMLVPESYVITNRAGVSTIRLGGEQQLSHFVLGASFVAELSSNKLVAGCGLVLETSEEYSYSLAWLDNTGSAGLSRREGEVFTPGPVRDGLPVGNTPHQLLVVADGKRLLFFADQHYIGQLPAAVSAGTVGNAALSFDNLSTTCRFSDTWVWHWSEE